ncbi:hypothetical protein [Pseudarthrobacter sp. WHRI 8279]|uniref:hypothetical protein n=1 Tax=Pseudarthrobacter sp. WHRI 8279 TaxID=3162566 RepID=UPI0032EB3D7B
MRPASDFDNIYACFSSRLTNRHGTTENRTGSKMNRFIIVQRRRWTTAPEDLMTRTSITRREYDEWVREAAALGKALRYPITEEVVNDSAGIVFGADLISTMPRHRN